MRCAILVLCLGLALASGARAGSDDPILLTIDPATGEIVDANVSAGIFYGWPIATLRAMRIDEINMLSPEQIRHEMALARDEERGFFIFRHRLASGDTRTVEVRSERIERDGRTLLRSTIRDISAERAMESYFWHYHSNLEAQLDAQAARLSAKSRMNMIGLAAFAVFLAAMLALTLWLLRRRRRAEHALAQARQATEQLLGNMREHFIYRHGVDGVFSYVSPSVESVLGYTVEEFKCHYATFYTDHPQNALARAYTRQSINGERPPAYLAESRTRTGEKRTLRISETPVFDERGRVIAVEGVAQDCTWEEALNLRIREQAIAMEEVLAGTGAGSWIWDIDTGAFTIDQRFADICGLTLDPATTWTIDDARRLFGAAEDDGGDPLDEAAARGEPGLVRERVAEVRTSDGDIGWVAIRGRLSADGGRRISGTIIAITARVKEEEALRKAKAEAESANEAKSRFLAAMSHDLRTPLNAIIGFSELIRAETHGPLGDPHYRDYLEDIHQSGHLLLSLINDILDLSKIESGKYVLEPEPIDLAEFARAAVRRISTFAAREGVRVVSDITDGTLALWADERAMTQVFNNLLSNAVKFSEPGDQVTLSARWRDDGAFEIAFADEGVGMRPEEVRVVLEPFEQVRGKTEGPHKGTGLGLPICTRLMALHGGALEIESAAGVGSTIRLRFPHFRIVAPVSETKMATVH